MKDLRSIFKIFLKLIFFEWIPIKVSHCDVITSDGEVITSDENIVTSDETLSHVTKHCHMSPNTITTDCDVITSHCDVNPTIK